MTPGLGIEGLTSGYGRRTVIRDLTVPEIPPGHIAAVIGPNASGKSTLLKTLFGLCPTVGGRVHLFGEDLSRCQLAERACRIGYLPQQLPQATTLVAYEMVLSAAYAGHAGRAGTRTSQARVEAVFNDLGIRDLALCRMGEMSGGQRQLVGLAQVLVRRPGLILLDEPTSALDLRWQLRVLEAVRANVCQGGAVCLVALHDLNLALRFADSIILLAGGTVLAAGLPPDALTPEMLGRGYGVEARVETCSRGHPIILADRALPPGADGGHGRAGP